MYSMGNRKVESKNTVAGATIAAPKRRSDLCRLQVRTVSPPSFIYKKRSTTASVVLRMASRAASLDAE